MSQSSSLSWCQKHSKAADLWPLAAVACSQPSLPIHHHYTGLNLWVYHSSSPYSHPFFFLPFHSGLFASQQSGWQRRWNMICIFSGAYGLWSHKTQRRCIYAFTLTHIHIQYMFIQAHNLICINMHCYFHQIHLNGCIMKSVSWHKKIIATYSLSGNMWNT